MYSETSDVPFDCVQWLRPMCHGSGVYEFDLYSNLLFGMGDSDFC